MLLAIYIFFNFLLIAQNNLYYLATVLFFRALIEGVRSVYLSPPRLSIRDPPNPYPYASALSSPVAQGAAKPRSGVGIELQPYLLRTTD